MKLDLIATVLLSVAVVLGVVSADKVSLLPCSRVDLSLSLGGR